MESPRAGTNHGHRPRLMVCGLAGLLAMLPALAVAPVQAATSGAGQPSAGDLDGDGLTNAFERNRSLTDELKVDSNGNGVPDGAEDPDGDGVVNIWEQRLKLNPRNRDTDADGVRDDREDPDGDRLTNGFEIRWQLTDPRDNDSDGDGVRDSAEDPDGDRLGNLGEQRWHTSPAKRDTDGDGTPDGAEDANGNGMSNAAEQDVRHVPHHLTPALDVASEDLPITYADGCHVGWLDDQYRHCIFGDVNAPVRIALFGDSHAAQWFPALLAAATARGWRVDNYTRSGCPSADLKTLRSDVSSQPCLEYRPHALADMAADPPTVVIVSNLRGYPIYDANDERVPPSDYEAAWDAGLARTLRNLPAASRAVVLADTPLPAPIVAPTCLQAHPQSIAACEGTRAAWINAAHNAGERATATANGARFRSLNGQVCPYDPCGVVFDELLVYRDVSHLTATFARNLAPSLGTLLDAVLAN